MAITRNKGTAMLPIKINSIAVATLAVLSSLGVASAASLGSSGSFGGTVYSVLPVANGQVYLSGQNLRSVPEHTANAIRVGLDHPEKVLPFFQGTFAGSIQTSLNLPGSSHQIVFGGDFTSFNGESGTAGLVRINADGSRDQSLNVGKGFDKTVFHIAQTDDGTGDLWVEGIFTNYNGSPANGLVRISSTGKLIVAPDLHIYNTDQGYLFVASDVLSTIDGSGGVFLAGTTGVFKLTKAGVTDSNFLVPNISNNGNITLVRTDGGILLGGGFSYYSGARNSQGLLKIKETGEVDPTFEVGHGFNGTVNNITIAPDESQSIYVQGSFSTYDGTPVKNDIVRLNPNGLLDLSFAPSINSATIAAHIRALPGGQLALYGNAMANIGSYPPLTLAAFSVLDSTGAVVSAFQKPIAESDGGIHNLALLPDGSVLLSGSFSFYGVTTLLPQILRLNEDGSLDSSFTFKGADATAYLGVKLAASATNPDLFYGSAYSTLFSFDPQGQETKKSNNIYVGLNLFSLANGEIVTDYGSVQVLHADLTEAKEFVSHLFYRTLKTKTDPERSGEVTSIAPTGESDGSFWVAGDFKYYGKSNTGSVVKLRPDGSEAGHVSKLVGHSEITASPDRSQFWVLTSVEQQNFTLSLMDHNGSIKNSFAPTVGCDGYYNHTVFTAAQDGSVYIIGSCNNGREIFEKIHADGSVDQTFSKNAVYDQTISTIVPVPGSTDFDIVGNFTNYNGKPRGGLARVHADGSVAD
jgi:hypothetical protein